MSVTMASGTQTPALPTDTMSLAEIMGLPLYGRARKGPHAVHPVPEVEIENKLSVSSLCLWSLFSPQSGSWYPRGP